MSVLLPVTQLKQDLFQSIRKAHDLKVKLSVRKLLPLRHQGGFMYSENGYLT